MSRESPTDTFYVFRNVCRFPKPAELPIENFCSSVFDDIQNGVPQDAFITEIVHFKEKVCKYKGDSPLALNHILPQSNLAHDFLVAEVVHHSVQYYIRVERSTAKVKKRKSWLRTSSSIAVVADAVRIARNLLMLTSGLGRGDSDRIATLQLQATPYPFSEFCLILSMFCVFSPEYKLMGEQCYWFADVILRAVQKRRPGAGFVKGKNFHMAGKYGSISVPLSIATREKLIDTFETLASLNGLGPWDHDGMETWWHSSVHVLDFLLLLMSSPVDENIAEPFSVTTEVRRRATGALARITTSSPSNQNTAYLSDALSPAIDLLQSQSGDTQRCALVLITDIISHMADIPALVEDLLAHLLQLLGIDRINDVVVSAIVTVVAKSAQARSAIVDAIPDVLSLLTFSSDCGRLRIAGTIRAIVNMTESSLSNLSKLGAESVRHIFQIYEQSPTKIKLALARAAQFISVPSQSLFSPVLIARIPRCSPLRTVRNTQCGCCRCYL
jgi:putative lipoic acid-binding regulatory protein